MFIIAPVLLTTGSKNAHFLVWFGLGQPQASIEGASAVNNDAVVMLG